MTNLEQMVKARFADLVLFGCALAFAGILFELIGYEHYEKGTQIVGFVATIAGLVFSLLGLVRAAALRTVTLVALAVLAVIGVYGTFEHRETRVEDAAKFAQRQAQAGTTTPSAAPAGAEVDGPPAGELGTPRKFRSNIPVLAPMAVSGLSALAFLAVLARRRDVEGAPVPVTGLRTTD